MDIAEYGTRIVQFRDGQVVVRTSRSRRRRLAQDELAALPPAATKRYKERTCQYS